MRRFEGPHKLQRVINEKNKAYFSKLLTEVDRSNTYEACNMGRPNTNEAYNLFIDQISSSYDKTFSVMTMPGKHRNSTKQPWITFGLLKSCNK